MKNISLCIFISLIIILTSTAPALAYHADSFRSESMQINATVPLYLSAELGMANGQAREIVYNENKGRKISELRWDIDKVMMVGFKGSADFTDWLSLNIGAWTNITSGDSGNMIDLDWLDDDRPRDWTDKYQSKSNVNRAIVTDANIEARLIETKFIDISALAGFKFDNWSWENSGGEYIYGDNGFRNKKVYFSENDPVISYEQWYYCPYLGIQTDSDFGEFKLKTYVKGTIFAWATDEDHHWYRSLKFQDYFYNMKYIGAGISGSYSFSQNIFSTISFDYQKYFEQYGKSKVIDSVDGYSSSTNNSAGMGHESIYLSIKLGLKF